MASTFQSIGVLYHPMKPESLPLSEAVATYLREHRRTMWIGSAWDEADLRAHTPGLDLLITLGGDGTILRAARVGSEFGVPVLGVKLGRVGFLAEVSPEDWQPALARMLTGDYWLEERMLLQVAVAHESGSFNHSYRALNDVVVSRGGLARLINVDTWIDETFLTSYRADGVIVSTPTGCTGYALAAGGPILPPDLKNVLLIPICPHLTFGRPMVLSGDSSIAFQVHADYPAILTVDGQFEITLAEGDRVQVRASREVSEFVRLQDRAYFYRTLTERLRCTV